VFGMDLNKADDELHFIELEFIKILKLVLRPFEECTRGKIS
jgi:hypothetical protein